MQVANAGVETNATERDEDICIAIEQDSDDVASNKGFAEKSNECILLEKKASPPEKSTGNGGTITASRTPSKEAGPRLIKKLKKFNAIVDTYRKYQPKTGKEPKVSEFQQAQIGKKLISTPPKLKMAKSVWNPLILSESERMN